MACLYDKYATDATWTADGEWVTSDVGEYKPEPPKVTLSELLKSYPVNRHERRKRAAELRKLKTRRHK